MINEKELITIGKYRYGQCPFCHAQAKTLVVTSDNEYHCMTCGKSGILGEEEVEPVGVKKSSRLLALNTEAAKIFVHELNSKYGKTGLDYFTNRGLTADTIKRFGLGYANPKLPLQKYLMEKHFTEAELVESGLFGRNEDGSLWFQLKGRVIYPIVNTDRKVIGFGGRVLDDSEPKYKNSPETPVFSKRDNLYAWDKAIRSRKNHIILCEGYMDVISMHQAGFSNTVASLGTALTESQARLIKTFTDRVIILYDTDVPGVKATERAIEVLKKVGIRPFTANSLPYKDPDEYIKKAGADELRVRLKKPMTAKEYLIRHALDAQGETDFQQVCDILLDGFNEAEASKLLENIAE